MTNQKPLIWMPVNCHCHDRGPGIIWITNQKIGMNELTKLQKWKPSKIFGKHMEELNYQHTSQLDAISCFSKGTFSTFYSKIFRQKYRWLPWPGTGFEDTSTVIRPKYNECDTKPGQKMIWFGFGPSSVGKIGSVLSWNSSITWTRLSVPDISTRTSFGSGLVPDWPNLTQNENWIGFGSVLVGRGFHNYAC